MPVWTDLVEPVAAGVTDAVATALEGQLGSSASWARPGCRPARGDARPGRPDAPADARLDVLHAARPGHRHARRRGAHRLRGLAAARARADRGAHAGRAARLRRGPRGRRAPGAALPRGARGGPGAAVRRRAVAGPRAARRRARLRGRHQHRHRARSRRRCGPSTPPTPRPCSSALQGRMFAPQHSPAQQAALARLETLLALVEGWVDVVTERATRDHLPQADALGEAVRRRRATGGPAEKAFGALVGLELRPRRLRDAANLFAALEDSGGAGGPRRRLAPPRPRARAPPTSTTRWATSSGRHGPRATRWMPRSTACCAARTPRDRMPRPGSATRRRARRRPRRRGGVPAPPRRRRGRPRRLGGAGRRSRSGCAATTSTTSATHPDGVAKAGPPAHLTASCLVLDETGERVLLTLHRRAQRSGSSSAGTSRPATPRCGRRPGARPARSRASTPSSRSPRPVQLDRHVLVGSFGALPRAPRRALRRRGARRGRGPGQRGVARRAVVAGRRAARGHPRRARAAGVTRPGRPGLG